MVSIQSIRQQLKDIKFNARSWNRPEAQELANIILPDEIIYECVNGWYEGGVALLVATNIRVLLIDKKPFKFLSLEDVRFDTINQIDYGRRLFDAHIVISAGMRDLTFRSYNKDRLRKLIDHVQHRMAEIKAEQADHSVSQRDHLKDINEQLKDYLISQYEQQEAIKRELAESKSVINNLSENQKTLNKMSNFDSQSEINYHMGINPDELYNAGIKEIFGKINSSPPIQSNSNQTLISNAGATISPLPRNNFNPLEINPLKIAYSKLPMMLRNRRKAQAVLTSSVTRTPSASYDYKVLH